MSELKADIRLAKIVHVAEAGHTAGGSVEVVINRGSRHGVKMGDQFLVFGIGPHIADPDTGEDLGVLELVRGRGKVVHVQEQLATLRTINRRRTRGSTKRITREPAWATAGLSGMLGGLAAVTEEELSPEEEVPFDSVQLGDLAKPV